MENYEEEGSIKDCPPVTEKPVEKKEEKRENNNKRPDEECKIVKVELEKKVKMAEEPKLPPPNKCTVVKKVKRKTKVKKTMEVGEKKTLDEPISLPPVLAARVPVYDDKKNDCLIEEKTTVSLRAKEEGGGGGPHPHGVTGVLPEEMSMVPVCSTAEEIVPVQTNGIIMDNGAKLIGTPKPEMIVNGPLKLVTSQYIEQPFVQAVMPVQMPVTYQIPIVKLSQTSGMFFSQVPNYIIPPSPPVFGPPPPPPVSTFRNGFHFSTSGTAVQFQASSTTLQQTTNGFMQSTNSSGFQIVQSPAANIQQSVLLTAFQNSGIPNINIKSPTLRLLNCQPLILNNAKPLTNVSLTVTNVSSVSNPNAASAAAAAAALTVPTLGVPTTESPNKTGQKIITAATPNSLMQPMKNNPGPMGVAAAAASMVTSGTTTPKKLTPKKLNILPKPPTTTNLGSKSGIADGGKSKKQCLQPCGPAPGTTT